MSIKDLFNKKNNKLLSNVSLDDTTNDVESPGYVEAYIKEQDRFIPQIDFSRTTNFVKFGSAKKYYEDSISRIYNNYPFDGSEKEKIEFKNSGSFLDKYILENEYPKSTGYVKFSPAGWGTLIVSSSNGFGLSSQSEYIEISGVMNLGPDGTRIEANKYDEIKDRTYNLRLDGNEGNTVEFWIKKGAINNSKTSKEVVFDLWNSVSASHAAGSDYGRFIVYFDGNNPSPISSLRVTYVSGAVNACTDQILGSSDGEVHQNTIFDDETWTHFAVSAQNSGSDLVLKLHKNGILNDTTIVSNGAINEVTGALIANIGSLRTSSIINESPIATLGSGKLSGSIDEFRFWRRKRNSKDIGQNWFRQVAGGTNTDDSNVELGVYYKFNEGITNTSSADSIVLDYSGRLSHGKWIGYSSSAVLHRSTGSAIIESSASISENADPIIYSFHPHVVDYYNTKISDGTSYDDTNNSAIINTIPDWIRNDEKNINQDLENLVQIIASYFDSLYLQIESIPKITNVDYVTSSQKPFPFAANLLESVGFVSPELFVDADVISQLASRDEKRDFQDKLYNVKNFIYQNIYNNLIYIFKSKGTEKSFRNLIRCYGIDDELIKLNLYGNNVNFELRDNFKTTSIKKKYVDFNDPDRFDATVYQYTDLQNSNTVSYISGSTATEGFEASGSAITIESEVIFPKKHGADSSLFFDTPFISASLFGMHTAQTSDSSDTSWNANDVSNFQVYAVRDKEESRDVYFKLTGSTGGIIPAAITSSLYKNVYDGSRWNLAVRVKPEKYPFVNRVSGTIGNYVVELHGVNTFLDSVQHEFTISSSIAFSDGYRFLVNPKRLFVGAHRTNFTGSVIDRTDIRISSLRYWLDYLDDETILAHAKDPSNFGRIHPYRSSRLLQNLFDNDDSDAFFVPQIDTLALHWDFTNVTASGPGSTGNSTDAQFIVDDVSSGSLNENNRYRWIGGIVKNQHSGRGDFFLGRNKDVVDREYVYSAKQKLPESLDSGDMINILERDDEKFTRESRPINYYFSIEKSMYQIISSEMINMFATIKDFNNLIGEPVNRYRQEYKSLGKLRQLFYERVRNVPDVEKFIDFYKWIDESLSSMVEKLIPASANFSPEIRNLIESHVLERNKYQTKYTRLNFKSTPPEGGTRGINELTYNWKHGHASPSGKENQNCLWWAERAERNEFQNFSPVSSSRSEILKSKIQVFDRKFSTQYKLDIDKSNNLVGGINYENDKISLSYVKNAIQFGDVNKYLFTTASSFISEKDCNDELEIRGKRYREYTVLNVGEGNSSYASGSSKFLLPFNFISSSATGGYRHVLENNFQNNTDVVDIHRDFSNPLQGPFTERHVGGLQYRHVTLNSGAIDTFRTRPEGYKLYFNSNGKLFIQGPDTRSPQVQDTNLKRATYYRDETAKRPLNIKNIKKSYGNYNSDYEIVQTSGRYLNSKAFVVSGGIEASQSFSTLISGVLEYSKPPRGDYKHVFIERFSAPGGPDTAGDNRGGPGLDTKAAEFSIYNNLNYRNLTVRLPLKTLLSKPCGQFGIDSEKGVLNPNVYETSASFHKVNRNICTRLELNASTPVTGTVQDNWWIQHTIPPCDAGYSWISSSLDTESPFGFVTGSGDIAFVSASDFVSFINIDGQRQFGIDKNSFHFENSSSNRTNPLATDFVGMSYHIVDPITSSLNTLGFPRLTHTNSSTSSINYINDQFVDEVVGDNGTAYTLGLYGDKAFFNALMLNRNGPYGYPSWKQIRNREHAIVRSHVNNNIISLMDSAEVKNVTSNNKTFSIKALRSGIINNYTHSAITSRHKPMLHELVVEEDGKRFPTLIKHTYGNNLSTFGNKEISNKIGKFEFKKQAYNKFVDAYTTDLGKSENAVKKFVSISIKDTIFPKEENAYLDIARGRTNFNVDFWRDARTDRNVTDRLNSQGFLVSQSMWLLDGRKDFENSSVITGSLNSEGELQNAYTTFFGCGNTDYNVDPRMMGDFTNPWVVAFNSGSHKNTNINNYNHKLEIGNKSAAFWDARIGNSGPDAFSISTWIWVTASFPASTVNQTIIEFGNKDRYVAFRTGSNGDPNLRELYVYLNATTTPGEYTTITSPITSSQWHHVVFAFELGQQIYFYVDGVQHNVSQIAAFSGFSTTINGNPLDVQCKIGSSSVEKSPFEGYIYDMAVYNSQLSEDSVKEIYNNGVPTSLYNFDSTSSLVAWWKMGAGRGIGRTDSDPAITLADLTISDVYCDKIDNTGVSSFTNRIWNLTGDQQHLTPLLHPSCSVSSKFSLLSSDMFNSASLKIPKAKSDVKPTGSGWASCLTPGIIFSRRHPEYIGTPWQRMDITSSVDNFSVRVTGSRIFSGDTKWTADKESGKTPFYETYADYTSDIRAVGKDYAIIPEFRISDLMDTYIDVEGGNFQANVDEFLSITGAFVEKSSNENFYKIYTNSDFMSFFDVVQKDHEDIADPTEITLKCKAIMKFLPYEGFYPVQRTKQLATLFSQSYGDFVFPAGYGDNSHSTASWRAFLSPFFGPGILFNSIKSGMAVDYPIYSDDIPPKILEDHKAGSGLIDFDHLAFDGSLYNTLTTRGYYGFPLSASVNQWIGDIDTSQEFLLDRSEYGNIVLSGTILNSNEYGDGIDPVKLDDNVEWRSVLSGDFSKRIPFEGLVEPENYIAKSKIWDMEPEPSASLRLRLSDSGSAQSAFWSGEGSEKYKLAMHNFLAEVPDFFLRDSKFTTFASKPILPDGIEVREEDKDKYFGMDITINNSRCRNLTEWSQRLNLNEFSESVRKENRITEQELNNVKGIHTIMYDRDSAFGPPWLQDSHIFKDSSTAMSYHYGYEPFTPSYFNGFGLARILFKPFKGAGKYTLDEIQSNATTSFYRMPTNRTGFAGSFLTNALIEWPCLSSLDRNLIYNTTKIASSSTSPGAFIDRLQWMEFYGIEERGGKITNPPAGIKIKPELVAKAFVSASNNWMQIDSSVNLFGKTKIKNVTYEKGFVENFEPLTVEDAGVNGQEIWTIQPKWETPIFNFIDKVPVSPQSNQGTGSLSKGIWHQYGSFCTGSEGIWFGISDVPNSLINSFGFEMEEVGRGAIWKNRAENEVELEKTNSNITLHIRDYLSLHNRALRIDGVNISISLSSATASAVATGSNFQTAVNIAEAINYGTDTSNDNGIDAIRIQSRFTASAYVASTTPWDQRLDDLPTMASGGSPPAYINIRVDDVVNEFSYPDPFRNTAVKSQERTLSYPNFYSSAELGNKKQISLRQNDTIFTFDNENTHAWILEGGSIENNQNIVFSTLVNFSGGKREKYKVESLADLLGFKKEKKRLGQVKNIKKISEAVVAVPFLDLGIGGKRFFLLSRERIDVAQGRLKQDQRLDDVGNSIIDMVNKMKKYVFPPKMDFITNEDIQPFAMYIFEFEHELTKQDLGDIWQNLPPNLTSKYVSKESTIKHDLLRKELLSSDNIDRKLRWMIFKVKQRAQKNYFAKTADSSDDSRFKFRFNVGGKDSSKESIPDYSYNWPYDFFSLIELVKLDSEIKFTNEEDN